MEFSKKQLKVSNISLIEENKKLKNGIKKFVDKNFVGGQKSDREDYTQMVSCKDIYELRNLIK